MAACDPATRVIVDETSTPTTMTPLRARTRRGQRAIGRVPRALWTTLTLLATLTPIGLGPGLQITGALDRQAFDTYVEAILVPNLRPGHTVIPDKLSVHHNASAKRLIKAAGRRLVFLPTHSREFNSIERAFAIRKLPLRTVSRHSNQIRSITATSMCGSRLTTDISAQPQ